MKVGITGVSGFIGSRVAARCGSRGIEVVGFSRNPGSGGRRFELTSAPDISGLDAIVNLAGEPILGLWTKEKKRRIHESRVLGTRRVVEAIAKEGQRTGVLVNASAIGFYGDTGENVFDEFSGPGSGFLADVCREWEAEAARAISWGVRVIFVRIGFVLGRGGALKLLRPLFKLGLGGRLGNGRQWMSGVHVDDVAGMIVWALENESLHGPVNAVMPEPFRNADFTRELARCVMRPAILPAPAFALRLAFGELADSMLASTRVMPSVAQNAGYTYQFATLPSALADAAKQAK
jgi:uncharacterized protein (TIGR01777 family)